MKTPSIRFVSFLITYLFVQLYSFGQPPSLVNFRGQLLNSGGQPVTSTVTIDLRVFPAQTGGAQLYLENVGSVEVRNGQYAFQFGTNGSPDLTSVIKGNAETWVEVSVDNNALPRQRFVSVPYALNAGSAQIATGAVTRDMLSQEILNDLNRTQISNGSITREMLAHDLLDDFKTTFDSLYLPPSSSGMPLVGDSNFTVPEGKVLAITYIGKSQFSGSSVRVLNQNLAWNHTLGTGVRLLDENTSFVLGTSWQNNYNSGVSEDETASFVGIMYEKTTAFFPVIGPEIGSSSNYTVPNGKNLVITSLSAGGLDLNSKLIYRVNRGYAEDNNIPIILPSDTTFKLLEGPFGFTGYLIDENRTLGGGSSTPQPSSVNPDMLSDSILKYLKPEISQQPLLNGQVNNGQSISLSAQAEGKYLTYQWKKNGNNLTGETNATLTISAAIASQHDGNYTLVVTNDFGSVETTSIPVNVLARQTHTADLNATVQLEMLWVEPGTFTMGSPTTETGRGTIETEHDVSLTKGFYLGKYEVTQAQYEAVMSGNTNSLSATPSNWPNNPNRPVEKVSWDDVQIFLTRLNASEQAAGRLPSGWSYVLPTESQWEYACRAGTTTAYSWGDTIDGSKANYSISGLSQTTDVGQYAANPWGFFDMHGNVYEWTADWYGATYPTGNPVVDPTGPASGSYRVQRGGSWTLDGTYLRSAKRSFNPPSGRFSTLGFRVGFKQQ